MYAHGRGEPDMFLEFGSGSNIEPFEWTFDETVQYFSKKMNLNPNPMFEP